MSGDAAPSARALISSEDEPKPAPIWVLCATQFLGAAAFASLGKYIPVYFVDVGLSPQLIGVLGLVGLFVNFSGQLFWSWVIAKIGDYKTVLVGTQFIGTCLLLCYTFDVVKDNPALIVTVTILNGIFMSTGGSIIDAMCMTVLDQYKNPAQNPHRTPRTREMLKKGADYNYGNLRLWSAVGWGGMSLVTGQFLDDFGINYMFWGFAVIQAINIGICAIWMPKPRPKDVKPLEEDEGGESSKLFTLDVFWFFCNLIVYGIGMVLIENFLFVFLVSEFDDTPNFLLGASTAIMCLFEIPVFKFLGWFIEDKEEDITQRITLVLFACQIIVALRCFLYLQIPKDKVWLVLFVEPLHGICFAGMWGTTMEYAKRLAGKGNIAQMTALVNGVYYQISFGIGSLMWGTLVTDPPTGVGFRSAFNLDIIATLGWSVIWQIGLLVISRYSPRPGAQAVAPAQETRS